MKRLFKDTKKINHLFSKVIVIYCVVAGSIACRAAFKITRDTGIDTSAILLATLGFFGGELLFLCLRFIFKSKNDGGTFDGESEE